VNKTIVQKSHATVPSRRFPPSVARAKFIKVKSQEGKTERGINGRGMKNPPNWKSAASEIIRI
jgi:hypothetical protein